MLVDERRLCVLIFFMAESAHWVVYCQLFADAFLSTPDVISVQEAILYDLQLGFTIRNVCLQLKTQEVRRLEGCSLEYGTFELCGLTRSPRKHDSQLEAELYLCIAKQFARNLTTNVTPKKYTKRVCLKLFKKLLKLCFV